MKKAVLENRKLWIGILTLMMMLQFFAASYFCVKKEGFHYDEYYSYYSSNVTYGLAPTDREWKDTEEIRSEFMVLPGEGFNYEMVGRMQTYDVHPPLYYFFLHTICSLFPGVFSKWFGLSLNLLFFVMAYWLYARISCELFRKNREMTILSCLLFGFQPGILSGITFIRMYMLLLVWCLALICWHIPLWQGEIRLTLKRVISLILLVTAGFLTHYYFAVFLFFSAAFTCLFHWLKKRNLKGSIAYGSCVCAGMVLAVLLYPSSLSHIFRGYRGTEATDAFFDLSNTFLRLDFFSELMNASVFGGLFWLLILLLFILFLLLLYKRREGGLTGGTKYLNLEGYFCLLTVTLGYFFVVAKTALLNAEEANRYELPVYGFWMLIVLAGIYLGTGLIQEAFSVSFQEQGKRLIRALSVIILGCQLSALMRGEVQFLYEEDREHVDWAAEHREEAVVYLYNPANVWMVWDEAEELMQYERIYFVSLTDPSPIEEKELLEADRVYVYSSRMDEREVLIDGLIENSRSLSKKEELRQLLYCDLYCLE